MGPLERAAIKEINGWVEDFDGNWREVRKEMLFRIGQLAHHGTAMASAYAHVLGQVYEEMEPKPLAS